MSPGTAPYVLYGLLLVALAISLVTDLRARKIYDVVTLPTLGAALLSRLLLGGWDGPFGMAQGLVGALVGFLIFLGFAWTGGMGMGDVKLVAAIGGALGFPLILAAVVFIVLAGGLQAILATIWSGSLVQTARNTGTMILRALRLTRREVPKGQRQYVPYGVAIAAGTVWAVLWQPWIGAGSQ